MNRIWRLNINLDAFNSVSAASYSDEMRSLAFQGLALGLNGGALPSSVPESFSLAYAVGKVARDEALEHQKKSSCGGKNSAKARRQRSATSTKIEPPFEPTFEPPFEPPFEPILKPKAESLDPENRDPKTEKKTPPTPPETAATLPTPPVTVPPRAREPAPAAPGWSSGLGATVREEREVRQSARRQKWLKDQGVPVDFTSRPHYLQWASYCKHVHPSWQGKDARKAYDVIAMRNWTQGGRKIESWWQVADAWANNADQTEHFDAFMDGSFGLDVGGMSAKDFGITTGEGFS